MKYLKEVFEKVIEVFGNKDKDIILGLILVIDKMVSELRLLVR